MEPLPHLLLNLGGGVAGRDDLDGQVRGAPEVGLGRLTGRQPLGPDERDVGAAYGVGATPESEADVAGDDTAKPTAAHRHLKVESDVGLAAAMLESRRGHRPQLSFDQLV